MNNPYHIYQLRVLSPNAQTKLKLQPTRPRGGSTNTSRLSSSRCPDDQSDMYTTRQMLLEKKLCIYFGPPIAAKYVFVYGLLIAGKKTFVYKSVPLLLPSIHEK